MVSERLRWVKLIVRRLALSGETALYLSKPQASCPRYYDTPQRVDLSLADYSPVPGPGTANDRGDDHKQRAKLDRDGVNL